MLKGRNLVEGAGFLFAGGDGFGRQVLEVIGVVGADEGGEGDLLVGDFRGEGEGDILGSFPVRDDDFSLKAFGFGSVFEGDVDFLDAQFFWNGVADDEGDFFARGGGFGDDEGDEFLDTLVLVFRLFVFSTGGATGGGFLLFFIGVKMADLGIVTFLECFEGVVSGVGHFGEQLRLERAEGVGVFCRANDVIEAIGI